MSLEMMIRWISVVLGRIGEIEEEMRVVVKIALL